MAKHERATVDALLERHGTTFADELGIDVAGGKPGQLFRLLATAIVLSTNLDHRTTMRGAAALKRWRSAHAMAEADVDEVRATFRDVRMQRTQSIGAQLHDAAIQCQDRWDGDLRRLRAEADGDVGRMSELLQEHKGLGPTGAGVFLREVQLAWEEVRPCFDQRGRDTAATLGLPRDPAKLAGLVDGGDVARLAAALVRASFDDDPKAALRGEDADG